MIKTRIFVGFFALISILFVSHNASAQGGGSGPGGGGGGGGGYTFGLRLLNGTQPNEFIFEYELDQNYSGWNGKGWFEVWSHGQMIDQQDCILTTGIHQKTSTVHTTGPATFTLYFVYSEVNGAPEGEMLIFNFEDGVPTVLMQGVFLGNNSVLSMIPRAPEAGECSTCGTAPQGGSVFASIVPVIQHYIYAFSAEPEVDGGCGCGGGTGESYCLPEMKSSVGVEVLAQDSFNEGSLGPCGFIGVYDTHAYFHMDHAGEGITCRLFDGKNLQTTTFRDGPSGQRDGELTTTYKGKITKCVMDGGITELGLATTMTLYRDDGSKYKFEVTEWDDGEIIDDAWGRLTEMEDRNGNKVTIAYGSERKISTVTDSHGNVLSFSWGADQGGRMACSSITLNGLNTISFSYANDRLASVTLPDGGLSNFSYGIDPVSQCATIERTGDAGELKTYVSADYMNPGTNHKDLVNQPAGVLRMVENGDGQHLMSIFVNPLDPENWRIWLNDTQLLEVIYGVSHAYFTSWSVGDPSNGYDAFTGSIEQTFYANTGILNDIAKIWEGRPDAVSDHIGRSYSQEYDTTHARLTKKTYGDSTFEAWSYNSFAQVTRYRDRMGRVTLYEYDAKGNMTKRKVGLLEVGGSDIQQGNYAEYINEYYQAGHVNAGLLKTAKSPNWDAANPDMWRTDYEYDSNDRLTKIIHPADAQGGTRGETVMAYDAYGRLFTSTDPDGAVTQYGYDEFNRHVETTYNDGSTTQKLFGEASSGQSHLVIKTKDRGNVVTTNTYDSSDRLITQVVGSAIDADILDGNADDTPITDTNLQSQTTNTYFSGTNRVHHSTTNGNLTTYAYDYRGRILNTTVTPRVGTTLTASVKYENNQLFEIEDFYGNRTYFSYRNSDGMPERTIRGAVPSYTLNNIAAVGLETRDLTPNANYVISDVIRNAAGETTDYIDPRNITTKFEYDSRGRRIRTIAADGTSVEAKIEQDFDLASLVTEVRSPRYFDSSDTNGYQNAFTEIDYTGRGLVKEQRMAPSSGVGATSSFTYTLGGKQATTVDPRGKTWTTFYHTCCGRLLGQMDPLGHGMYSNNDYRGSVTHTAQVANYASHTSSHDPLDNQTLAESTTTYDTLARPTASTSWLTTLGVVDPQAPPIAGLNGVSASDGLTSQYLYDHNLTDGYGLNTAGGVSVNKLGGGTYNVSIANVLDKLDDPIAQGGAGITFGAGCAGSAAVVINGEEEIAVAIQDGLGRTVCTATIESWADSNPNGLITWSCVLHDGTANVSGFGDTKETQAINALGKVTKARSDSVGRLIEAEDAEGNISTFQYDASGNRTQSRDPNGVGIDVVYDDLGRPTLSTDTEGDAVAYTYLKDGSVKTTTDAESMVVTTTYDAMGRTKKVKDRLNGDTIYTCDAGGNILSMSDAENQVTNYAYDDLGQLVTVTYPDHSAGTNPGDVGYGIKSYSYDALGRMEVATDQAGDSATAVFDLVGRVTSRDYRANGSSTIVDSDTFTYDSASRMLTANSGRYVNTVTLGYDEGGRRASEALTTGGQTYTTTFGYDDVSRMNSMVYPDGDTIDRTFTDRGQLHEVKHNSSVLDTRTYDVGGRLTNSALLNGKSTAYTYRLDDLTSTITTTGVQTFSYSYNDNKNITGETITGALSGYGFSTGVSGYDDEDRLINWNRTDGNQDLSWVLSLVGDWSSVTEEGILENRTHGDAHELTAVGSSSLAYDVKGNLTTNSGGATYTWDFDNRLAGADTDGSSGDDVTYAYDALGRRVSKTENGTTTVYVSITHSLPSSPAAGQVIAEYTSGAAPASPVRTYVYARYIDAPIALIDGSSGNRYFYHNDRRFSVVAMTNSTGSVVERYAYSPTGELVILDSAGTTVLTASTVGNEFTYTGRRWDASVEMYYFRARLYDPELGRFIGRDPIGYVDGSSLYRGYFGNQGIDPTGLKITREELLAYYRAIYGDDDIYLNSFLADNDNEIFVGDIWGTHDLDKKLFREGWMIQIEEDIKNDMEAVLFLRYQLINALGYSSSMKVRYLENSGITPEAMKEVQCQSLRAAGEMTEFFADYVLLIASIGLEPVDLGLSIEEIAQGNVVVGGIGLIPFVPAGALRSGRIIIRGGDNIGGATIARGIDGLVDADRFVVGAAQTRTDTCGLYCAFSAISELGFSGRFCDSVDSSMRRSIRDNGGIDSVDLKRFIDSLDDDITAFHHTGVDLGDIANSLRNGRQVIAFVDGNHYVRVTGVYRRNGRLRVAVTDSGRGGCYEQGADAFFTRMQGRIIISVVK